MYILSNLGIVYGESAVTIYDSTGKPRVSTPGPTGPAGGDLSGTYPNPGVVWANGAPTYNLLYYPLVLNPAGYIDITALAPYLTSLTAAATYYPIPTGTTSQYIRGDGSLATFPTIPSVTPSALTKVDDTNVTLTLGGTPATSLLQAVSLTLGWTGTLADGRIASASNWNTAYTNRITSLTTTGNSGAATLISNVLNIPNYTLAGLGGVPTTRNITINGVTQDLSADRTWTIAAGVTSVNSATGAVTLAVSDTGTGGTLQWSGTTLQIPEAASTKTGLLTSTDWSTFNGKQNALTNPVTGTGTNNEIAFFNSTGSTISSLTTATYPSLTELSYVKGVTSAIQTQINALPTASSTTTFTNKRITARTGTVASSATPTINTDNVDYFSITALAANITSMTTNLSGTPTTAQKLWISITDNGTARSITWGSSFEASGTLSLPTTTVISTRLDVGFVWNESTSKWRCVATS